MKSTVIIPGLLLIVSIVSAQDTEDWQFPEDDLEARIAAVSDGELEMLDGAPEKPVHHHHNLIRIGETSLEDGWVELEQCHSQLDPVAAAEIVYNPERIRMIEILSSENIAEAEVDGATLQLKDIGANARICLRAESRAFSKLSDDGYRLNNGPFMRRFLDGYYPMRVSLEIRYPARLLELFSVMPLPGKAGGLERSPGRILWDAWFTGRLFTEFEFRRAAN